MRNDHDSPFAQATFDWSRENNNSVDRKVVITKKKQKITDQGQCQLFVESRKANKGVGITTF